MAITPRTIFSSPASATVATISLLAFSALGTLAYQVAQDSAPSQQSSYGVAAADSCDGIRRVLGHNQSRWSETDWLVYGSCFEQKNNSRMAATVAARGLRHYPTSEALYNFKGRHELTMGEHAKAVDTLERGLRVVRTPTNGVMENNLAWAGLWAPRELDRQRSRTLYKRALRRSPTSCETVHTGIWVEYAIATETSGVQKYQALKNFLELRRRYEPCLDRIESGDWKTLVEVVGATLLFKDVDQNLSGDHPNLNVEQDGSKELLEVTQKLRERYRGASIDALCREAMPLARTHHECVEQVDQAARLLRKREEANKAAGYERHNPSIPRIRSAGGGSGGCTRTN